jgi:DNA-binding NtrC family response regulator
VNGVTEHVDPATEEHLKTGHFLRKHSGNGRGVPQLAPDALMALMRHNWPGNVCELENVIQRAILLSQDGVITANDLQLPIDCARARSQEGSLSFKAARKRVLDDFERELLTRLLAAHRGNVSRAARAAGKDRRDLGRLLKKHGLERSSWRPPPRTPGSRLDLAALDPARRPASLLP